MAEGGMGTELHALLLQLKLATGNREFKLLKLAAWCVGLTPRKLEEAHDISDLYAALKDVYNSNSSISILYLCLMEVKVDVKTVKSLPIKPESVENWKRKKEMKFALMVIGICNQITGKDCKRFINLWKGDIPKVSPDQLPDVETLFKLLFERRVVWIDKVERLRIVLGEMRNQACVDIVEKYQRSIKSQEPTRESEMPMLEVEKGSSSSLVGLAGNLAASHGHHKVAVRNHQLEHDVPISTANFTIGFNDDHGSSEGPHTIDTVGDHKKAQPTCPPQDNHRWLGDSGLGYSASQLGNTNPVKRGTKITEGLPSDDTRRPHSINSQSTNNSITDENTPLIKHKKAIQKVTVHFHSLRKLKPTLCCQFVVIVLVLATVAIVFVGLYFKQANGIAENAVVLTSLAHEGDTIYLDTVDGMWYKNISVTEVTQNGDASHENNIFLTDKDPKKHSMSLVHQSHTLHQDSSSYVTGSVRYQYLLDGSSVQYTMCLAYRTSGELYDSMVYVFNNAQHYWDYINEVPGAESYALCSKKLEVGMYNRSMCTPLECSISHSAFHFIAAKTGGDIFYNFSYTIDKVYLNRVDYSEVCNVFEGTDCKLDLPEATLYHVLAYTVPSESIESTITHLSLKTGTPSQSVSSNLTLYMILFIFCGCLALFCFLVLTVMCCFKYKKASLCSASIQ